VRPYDRFRLLKRAGAGACLGTSGRAHGPWLSKVFPTGAARHAEAADEEEGDEGAGPSAPPPPPPPPPPAPEPEPEPEPAPAPAPPAAADTKKKARRARAAKSRRHGSKASDDLSP
jgi:hypothetical protein